MKIEMKKAGQLSITPESPTDEYILQKWCADNFVIEDEQCKIKSDNLIFNLLPDSEQ